MWNLQYVKMTLNPCRFNTEKIPLLFRHLEKHKPVCFLMSSLPVLAVDWGVLCASLSGLGTGMNMLAGNVSVVATWKITQGVLLVNCRSTFTVSLL